MNKLMAFLVTTSLVTHTSASDISGTYLSAYVGKGIGINKLKSTTALRRDGVEGFEQGASLKLQKDLNTSILGLEGSFFFSNLRGKRWHKFATLQLHETIRKKYGGELCLNLGRKIESSHIYGKFGLNYSKFQFISTQYNYIKNIKGLVVGFGFETPITDNWNWGGEYKHNFFEKINFQVGANQVTCRLVTSQFGLKVNYKI